VRPEPRVDSSRGTFIAWFVATVAAADALIGFAIFAAVVAIF
jgi:NADH:ubiquinone oxidoreductase subunit K